MTTIPVPTPYYAKDLLKTAEQVEGAHLLFGALLTRCMIRGQRLNYFARMWGRTGPGLFKAAEQARVELAYREHKVPADKRHLVIPDPVPLSKLTENEDTYSTLLDDVERDACLALDDERTEALIRGMFVGRPTAVYFTKEVRRAAKAKAAPKRSPGRPKGAKNKPKGHDRDDDGWLMPDGRRVKL